MNPKERERMIRIAFFVNTMARGGVEEHILSLIQRLDRKEFDPHLICAESLWEALRRDLELPREYLHLVPDREGNDFRRVVDLVRIFRRQRFDIVHSHLFNSTQHAALANIFAPDTILIETHHVNEYWRGGSFLRKWMARRIENIAYTRVRGIIAVSDGCGKYLIDKKEIPPAMIRVIWNGRDLRRFDGSRFNRSEIRARLGMPDGTCIIGTVGRLEDQKDHRTLILAVEQVLGKTSKPFVLYIVGEGVLRPQLERLIEEKGLSQTVRLMGYQTNPEEWCAAFDLFVLSSKYEGFPLVLIEAGAMGLPVIATRVDGSEDIAKNGERGRLVPVGNPEALADAIGEYISNPSIYNIYSDNLKGFVMENLSEERQAERTQEFYREIFSGRRVN